MYLYNNLLQEDYRTPRYLLGDVVEKTVRDALRNFDNFPSFRIVNTNIDSSLRDAIRKTGVPNEKFERMYLFMCIWGDTTTDTYQEGDYTYISGLSTQVYGFSSDKWKEGLWKTYTNKVGKPGSWARFYKHDCD